MKPVNRRFITWLLFMAIVLGYAGLRAIFVYHNIVAIIPGITFLLGCYVFVGWAVDELEEHIAAQKSQTPSSTAKT